jgi:hypothetical protein
MGNKRRGLYHKFNIERTDGTSALGGKHESCDYFVLDLTHDPHAIPAMLAYAKSAKKDGYEELFLDIMRKLPSTGAELLRVEQLVNSEA